MDGLKGPKTVSSNVVPSEVKVETGWVLARDGVAAGEPTAMALGGVVANSAEDTVRASLLDEVNPGQRSEALSSADQTKAAWVRFSADQKKAAWTHYEDDQERWQMKLDKAIQERWAWALKATQKRVAALGRAAAEKAFHFLLTIKKGLLLNAPPPYHSLPDWRLRRLQVKINTLRAHVVRLH